MDFLRLLEQLRTPLLTGFFSAITYCGDQIFTVLAALTLYWCISKRSAYYTFCVCLFTILINQYLKIIFQIPRPWVIDPNFTIVESARAAAVGYSFPSGHTQNIIAICGCIALCFRKKQVHIVCLIFALLVPFSRMYLGVHTPLDVGVGALVSAVLVLAFYGIYTAGEASYRKKMGLAFSLTAAAAALLLLLLYCYDFGGNLDTENYNSAVKTAWVMLGTLCGFAGFWCLDTYRLQFDTKATLFGQILKISGGMLLMLGLRSVLKAPLYALFGGSYFADFWRYLLTVGLVGCLWPLSFPYLSKIGAKGGKNA